MQPLHNRLRGMVNTRGASLRGEPKADLGRVHVDLLKCSTFEWKFCRSGRLAL